MPVLRELTRQHDVRVQQRAGGNPLFLVNLVNSLVSQGVLAQSHAHWSLHGGVDNVAAHMPENVRQVITQQIERLSPEQQHVLESASAVGAEFSAASVASGFAFLLFRSLGAATDFFL